MVRRLLASVMLAVILVAWAWLWANTGHCADKVVVKRNPTKPYLSVMVFPKIQIGSMTQGGSVLVRAEIMNAESEPEDWYCPKVRWQPVGGTEATEESDCAPYEQRNECYPPMGPECFQRSFREKRADGTLGDWVTVPAGDCSCSVGGYPRSWTKRYFGIPGSPGEYEIVVVLEKAGEKLAEARESFMVR